MFKRILIVDDNGNNRYMLISLLEGEGLEVIAAENGKDALDMAHANPPEMIVSDILMPVMDGYTLCRHCKSDERLQNIPFIFYTATYTEPKDEKFALDIGADLFILKPQEPDVFINILKKAWEQRGAIRQTAVKPLGEEMEFFRQYNEILFNKLEKKMQDLEIANKKLASAEEQYRLSFENVTDVICTIDADLNVLSISPSLERMLGYKPQDFIGRPVSDLVNVLMPESTDRAMAEISLVLKGKTIPASIYPFTAKDGGIIYGEVNGSPVVREGRIIGIISVVRDVSLRMRAEEELRRTNVFLDSIIENIPVMLFIKHAGDLSFVRFNRAGEDLLGYSRGDMLGKSANDFFPNNQADYISESDREVLRNKATADIPEETLQTCNRGERILHTKKVPLLDANGEPEYLLGISEDITDRKQAEEALKETLASLRRAVGTTIQVMVSAVGTRDAHTAGHQLRVADLARAIATEMGLSPDRIDGIRMAGSIHDLGKLSIPAEILSKPTKLSEMEFALLKEHTNRGHEILKDVESFLPLAEIVYQHHERMDGSGYPRKLKGDEILLEARILAVADVVEAITSHRPYRPALGIDAALEEISKNRSRLYDPDVVDACLRLFREKGYNLSHPEAFSRWLPPSL